MIYKLNSSNFEKEVFESDKPVLVDFWADWCGPCKMLAPVIEELDAEYSEEYKICKVNVDEAPELAGKFRIVSIPTVLVFKDGELYKSSVGYVTKEKLLELFN